MTRYIAFLRAINLGGHTVRMDALRRLFESMGFARVETFIASGNVIFESKSASPRTMEAKIERALHAALGYEVATFIRTGAELAAIAVYEPFSQAALDRAAALNIAFLDEAPDAPSQKRVTDLATAIDDFHFHGRELYWLCRNRQSDSTFSNAVLEKTLARRSTLRGINTVQKLAAKYAPGP